MNKAEFLRQMVSERGLAVFDIDPTLATATPGSDPVALILLCTAGEAWAEFNMEIVHINPHTRLCFNNLMVSNYTRVSHDFAATVIALDPSFAQDAAIGIATEQIIHMFEQPVKRVDDDGDWSLLLAQAEALRCCCYGDLPNAREVALGLSRTLMLTLGGIMAREASGGERANASYTQADAYFRHFISCVSDHVATEHEVAFYASHLNITPKYLSDVCKRKSGRTAKDIISLLLASRIKHELITTPKSMKELAAAYGFANQSSLGKFFRKVVGKSPLYYKQEYGGPQQ